MEIIIAFIFLLLPFLLVFLWLRSASKLRTVQAKLQTLQTRFEHVIDADSEVEKVRHTQTKLEHDLSKLKETYSTKRDTYDRLMREAAIYDEQITLGQLGVYKPHFNFDDSDQFKANITNIRAKQKAMISAKTAIHAGTEWQISGSKTEGKKMTDRAVRLSLRAFNNECDAALSNATWRNATTMEKRIQKAYADINKLNKTLNISITQPYFKLKLKELWLTHEYREKQKEERDHATELRRQKREEEKLLKEAAAAEKEENKYRALLETAQAQAEKATGIDAAEYQARIAELSQQLEQAKGQAERAKSMAEQTRAGHIYVISNVGAFGEGIYKIGMTRRLDPMDRVKELGDASVPFLFDTHAMIYCEDAPSVERGLHAAFDKFRVNRANGRREFFRVSLQDIETEIQKIEPNADIITGIEAQEYHETLAIIAAESGDSQSSSHAFPTDL